MTTTYRFNVNGQTVQTDRTISLLDFLRDELRLTSLKNGCGEGACGACTLLVDGKKQRACMLTTQKADGKTIVTLEGLTQREKDVYAYCFAQAGAVQCGFCIPGMVISAKSLLDVNLTPTREDVKKAIRGNICRCTGYVKIESAILMAADFLRENRETQPAADDGLLGHDLQRVDAREKVLGTGVFTDDIVLPGMVYAKALRSRYPRARVLKIDTSRVESHPDVVRVLTAKDVPFNKTGHLTPDWDVMIAEGDCTRYLGDAIALVACRHKEFLDEALALIDVTYEELTPVTTPEEGLAEGAPLLHENGNLLTRQHVKRGDADKAIAEAAYVVMRHYSTPMTDHAFMEPECAVAKPDGNGGVILYTGSQSIYDEQREVARMLKLPPEKVRSISSLVGGGFGGKEDMSVQHHAALMAWVTGLPVKVRFSRQESLNYHVKRHAMEMDVTTACDSRGNLTAMKARIVSDCGAYASLSGPVIQRACTHAGGPYHYQNVDIEGLSVYTNNIPAGAFRGFGVTQSCFAGETNLNLLAEKAGISPWQIRFQNAVRPGDTLPNGQIAAKDTAYAECLLAVKEAYESSPYAGLAGAMKNSGLGVGVPDFGRVAIEVRDGVAHVYTSAACMGQGMSTVCVQMVCQTAGLHPSQVVRDTPDTASTPNSGTTTASRQTLFTGEAARRAAQQLADAMRESGSLSALEGRRFQAEFTSPTDPMGSDKPNPVSHVAYSYAAHVVIVDEHKRVTRVVAAHDVGHVVNPKSCEGQIEGGVVMGLGYAFTEDFPVIAGYPQLTYGKLGLWRATDVPPIDVKLIEKGSDDQFAFGAKGIGEISAIPTAPAAAHACMRVDGRERTRLPLEDTPYRKNL